METKMQQQAPQQDHVNKPNLTGIPMQMKLDFERRSGLSFDDVRVHYNSDKPARLQALAYTQGTHVYVGPGQERHLRHELGHVIQQKFGMVYPTHYIRGIPINNQSRLEYEADHPTIQCILCPTANKIIQLQPRFGENDQNERDDGPQPDDEDEERDGRRRTMDIPLVELPFNNENHALFASVHKDEDKQYKYGSLYFKGGRIRLIHPDGPKYSVDRGSVRRFLIQSQDDTQIDSAIGQLYDKFVAKEFDISTAISSKGCRIDEIVYNEQEIKEIVEKQRQYGFSRLYEVYFDEYGSFDGYHESRGGIQILPDSLNNSDGSNIALLFYVTKLAQATVEAAKDYIEDNVELYENQIYTKIVENEIAAESIRNLKRCITDKFNEAKAGFESSLMRLARESMELAIQTGIDKIIGDAAREACTEEELSDKKLRFGGYIGNTLFRRSQIIGRLGLRVDDKD